MMANYRWIPAEDRSDIEIQHPMFVEDLEKIRLTEEETEEARKGILEMKQEALKQKQKNMILLNR